MMNLMLWKKKTGGADEGGDVGASSPEAPPGTGLLARIKLRFRTLAGHFSKPPVFRAGEGSVPDMPDTAGPEPDIEPDIGPDREAEPELPDGVEDRQGWAARIKLQFAAMARRFRKPPVPEAGDGGAPDEADESSESTESKTPAKHGLPMRIKAGWAAFVREFKGAEPAADEEAETDTHGRHGASPDDEQSAVEAQGEPVRSRKWLVVGGSFVIVILMLVNFAIANWPLFKEQPKRWGTRHDGPAAAPRPLDAGPAPEAPRAEIEALMEENAALQARIEALKSGPAQAQPYVPPARQAGGNAAPYADSGELAVDSKDPKAAVMSLKEAIEAMNDASGVYDKEHAK